MDKIKTVKIKNEDGSVSEETYTISVDARNVDMDNGKELQETIGTINIDTDGNIAEQLENLNDNIDDLNIDIKKKAYFFNTVADMKNANLKAGDYVCTLGYYEANDGGAGNYQIVSGNYTDDGGSYHKLKNNLYAKLIEKPIMTPITFGAKGDNLNNDALNWSYCIKFCEDRGLTIDGLNKQYLIGDGAISTHAYELGLEITKTLTIKNAVFNLKNGVQVLTSIINIRGINNNQWIYFYNCTFNGNKITPSGTTTRQDGGVSGLRLRIGKVVAEKCNFINNYTDGVQCSNEYLELINCIVEENGRNGITANARMVKVNKCSIINNGYRADPKCGLEIEPDSGNKIHFKEINIKDTIFKDNVVMDIKMHLPGDGTAIFDKIIIDNCDYKQIALTTYTSSTMDSDYPNIIENLYINNCRGQILALTAGGNFTQSTFYGYGFKNVYVTNSFVGQFFFTGNSNIIKNIRFENCTFNDYNYFEGTSEIQSLEYIGCYFEPKEGLGTWNKSVCFFNSTNTYVHNLIMKNNIVKNWDWIIRYFTGDNLIFSGNTVLNVANQMFVLYSAAQTASLAKRNYFITNNNFDGAYRTLHKNSIGSNLLIANNLFNVDGAMGEVTGITNKLFVNNMGNENIT